MGRRLRALAIVLVFAAILTFSVVGLIVTGPFSVRLLPLGLSVSPSEDRLRSDVERLCTGFGPRDYRHAQNLDRIAEWIGAEFAAAGLEVSFQDYVLPEGRFRNVVGYRHGREPDAPVRVLGAHYDAFGELPGADDNASGVAVLLELVRTLPRDQPRRPQYFVAFSTEEPPFFDTEGMGSSVFARSLVERGAQVDLMVALDLVGYYRDEPGSQDFPAPWLRLYFPSRGRFVAVVGDLGAGAWLQRTRTAMRSMQPQLEVLSFRGPGSIPGVLWSDHASFRKLDLPGVLVTDTAFLRHPDYHGAGDTPDRLDYARMAQLVRALHGVVWDRDIAD